MLSFAMGGDGSSVDHERTVATAAVAAVPAIGEERRREDRQSGRRVRVTRLAVGDRSGMLLEDLAIPGMVRGQPLRRRPFEVVIAKVRHDVQPYLLGSSADVAA